MLTAPNPSPACRSWASQPDGRERKGLSQSTSTPGQREFPTGRGQRQLQDYSGLSTFWKVRAHPSPSTRHTRIMLSLLDGHAKRPPCWQKVSDADANPPTEAEGPRMPHLPEGSQGKGTKRMTKARLRASVEEAYRKEACRRSCRRLRVQECGAEECGKTAAPKINAYVSRLQLPSMPQRDCRLYSNSKEP